MDFGGGARRDIAVHESGHAVARVLSIGRVGITNENAIRWIEMDQGTPHCSVFELPLNMPGLREFGEREGIREGTADGGTMAQAIFFYAHRSIGMGERAAF